jgi:hypothetical protein
MESNK